MVYFAQRCLQLQDATGIPCCYNLRLQWGNKPCLAIAEFRRSLNALEAIQSRPELAQTLLAYGRFRRGDNRQEDQALIEQALHLFEEINAPGWVEEARAALATA